MNEQGDNAARRMARNEAAGRRSGPRAWPKITVATPSFNQGSYLEQCIRSVLQQGYPNLEYFIADGGSQDGSVDIIREYASRLSYWWSEKDRGQVHAINKCLTRASGEFFNWINSDDLLAPGALFRVAEAARRRCDLVAGVCINFDNAGNKTLVANKRLNVFDMIRGCGDSCFHQPALWWRTAWIRRCGGLDERFDLAFDYDLLLRYLYQNPLIVYTDDVLAQFRLHDESKTCSRADGYGPERERILEALSERADLPDLRTVCRRRLRQFDWWRQVDHILNRSPACPCQQALKLSLRAWLDPSLRMNRFTLGAIRKVLCE
jgi:glycosyltransferase involved in cell wall biosynthesis